MKRLLSLLTLTSAVVFSYAQSPLYINVDPICMDRFEYHINGESKGVEFISYRVRQTAKDFVFLEVGAESTGIQLSIPDSKDCRNVKFTPDFIDKINAGEAQVFIIRKAEIGYNISPVYLASYMYADSSVVKYKSNGLSFFANLGHISNSDNLAQADSNSDMYYVGDSFDSCLKAYHFRKSSKETCKPNVDIDIIPELGIVREVTRVSPLNTHESMLNLVRVNDVSFDTYTGKICEGKANLVYLPTTYVVESTDLSNLPITEVVIDGKTYQTDGMMLTTTLSSDQVITENNEAFSDFSDKFAVADANDSNIPAEYSAKSTIVLTEKGASESSIKVIKTEQNNAKIISPITEGTSTSITEIKKIEKIKCLNTSTTEVHIVQQGETLYGISRRYGLTVEQLKLWNKLSSNTINTCAALKIAPPQMEKKTVMASPTAKSVAATKEIAAVKSYEQPMARLTAKGVEEATNTTNQQQHIVSAGETISELATKYGYTEDRFRKMNNLGAEAVLEEGQILKTNDCVCPIPANYEAPSKRIKTSTKEVLTEKGISTSAVKEINNFKRMTVHIVENDDTLQSIAEKYHITVAQLMAINGLDEKDALIPNQRVFVD